MPARDPYKLPGTTRRLDSLRVALKKGENKPFIGVTQGGSSRKNAGAMPAATDADIQRHNKEYTDV